jgi:diguanylate cyclase (GGDEF)-like protein
LAGGTQDSGNLRSGVRHTVERLVRVPDTGSLARQRRARSILIIATGLAVVAVPTMFLVAWLLPNPLVNVLLVANGLLCYALIRLLVRTDRLSLASWVLVAYFVLTPVMGTVLFGQVESSPLFLVLVIVVAASLLPPKQVVIAAVLSYLGLFVMFLVDSNGTLAVSTLLGYVALSMLVITTAAVVLSLSIERALTSADVARRRAERLADDLSKANVHLESRVAERTAALQEALRREQVLSARLGELSVRDALTGLHNRRHLDEELQRMFAYAQRSGDPLSVAVIDLDNFKSINDRHTHLIGDDVLRTAAKVLAANIRGSDVLVRMGGEEFALLMPGTSEDAAEAVCERMRFELELHDWTRVRSGLSVTASFGVTSSIDHATAADLLRAADILLYRAKREGKNRVVCAPSATA